MYQHRTPSGELCRYLGKMDSQCLHCGTVVESALPDGMFDADAKELKKDDPKDGDVGDIEGLSTERIVEVLKLRGAEVGEISIGGISGTMLILRDRE